MLEGNCINSWWQSWSKLRNKFHFSKVHGSMNATGHMQSTEGRHVNFARDPLHSHFHEPGKCNSSLILHFVFYIIFVHYLWNFYFNLANKRRRKVIIRRVWLLCSKAMTWCQSNVMSANQLLHLSMISLMRNVTWTSVWTSSSKIGSSVETVVECKYLRNNFYLLCIIADEYMVLGGKLQNIIVNSHWQSQS